MESTIFTSLQRGERFSFKDLMSHYDEVDRYLQWWWSGTDLESLSRPYTLLDSDSVLEVTLNKPSADNVTNCEMFLNPFLFALKLQGGIPTGWNIPRETYRQHVIDYLLRRILKTEEKVLVFVGGGYGAGKTHTLTGLANSGALPFNWGAVTGVDYCKQLLPEFHRVSMVADGRGSEICQDESRLISDNLFDQLMGENVSFGWDSSMSNYDETLIKIQKAQQAGFSVRIIGVYVPIRRAAHQAMLRAKGLRRFANPKYLEDSHRKFARNFMKYAEICDSAALYFNGLGSVFKPEQPIVIAEKINSSLECYDERLLNDFLNLAN